MQNWSYVHGSDITILYNEGTGAYISLNHSFGSFIHFQSQTGEKMKRIDHCLQTERPYIARSGESSELLSKLQAGQGIKFGSRSKVDCHEWASKWEGPIISFRNTSYPDDRLYLTVDGFIYATSYGGVVVTPGTEVFTSEEKVKRALELVISDLEATNATLQVASERTNAILRRESLTGKVSQSQTVQKSRE
jgi:hypothetical protein